MTFNLHKTGCSNMKNIRVKDKEFNPKIKKQHQFPSSRIKDNSPKISLDDSFTFMSKIFDEILEEL